MKEEYRWVDLELWIKFSGGISDALTKIYNAPSPTLFFWPKHLWNKIIKFNKIEFFQKFGISVLYYLRLEQNHLLIKELVHTIKAIDSQKPNRMILCLTSLCCFCWQGFLFFIFFWKWTAIYLPEDFHRFILKCTADIMADLSKRWVITTIWIRLRTNF